MSDKKTSFAKNPSQPRNVTPAPVAEPMPEMEGVTSVSGAGPAVAAPAPAENNLPVPYRAPSVPAEAPPSRAFSDTALDDIYELRLPAINIVQGVGALAAMFTAGALVLNKQLEIAAAPPKQLKPGQQPPFVEIVIIGARPVSYVQKATTEEFEAGAQMSRFSSEQEVVANGGTTDYGRSKRDSIPLYERMVSLLVLVKMPKDTQDTSLFPLTVEVPGADGKPVVEAWAPALLHLRGVQYNNAFTVLATARRVGSGIDLRKGYYRRIIQLFTWLKPFTGAAAGRSCYIAGFKDGGPSNEDVVAEGYALIGQASPYGGIAPSQRPDAA